jgi:undecaprenyl-phosphate 4-deoxy-4-formamido-L-arabinose transferase
MKNYAKKHKLINELSVVIPCLNSEETLGPLVKGTREILRQFGLRNFEIILVLDGPMKGTKRVAMMLSKLHSEIRYVELTKNFGQHAAIFAGIHSSRFENILTLDDDGQHLPDSIPSMLCSLTQEIDIVYGISIGKTHKFWRGISSKFLRYVLFKFLGIKNSKNISSLRLFRKSLLKGLDLTKISTSFVDVILHWNTDRIAVSKVKILNQKKGKSNYNFRSLSSLAIKMIIGYSTKPLRLATYIGSFFLAISFLLIIQYLYFFFTDQTSVPGFTSIAILILVMASVQLILLGIIGEYIGSIHQKNSNRPLFFIKD